MPYINMPTAWDLFIEEYDLEKINLNENISSVLEAFWHSNRQIESSESREKAKEIMEKLVGR